MAKQAAEGGLRGVGLSLINYYAKTKKKARLIYMECLVPAGLRFSLGEGKAKTTFAHVRCLQSCFAGECRGTTPLFPGAGLRGESSLWFLLLVCGGLSSGCVISLNCSVCRFNLLTGR